MICFAKFLNFPILWGLFGILRNILTPKSSQNLNILQNDTYIFFWKIASFRMIYHFPKFFKLHHLVMEGERSGQKAYVISPISD